MKRNGMKMMFSLLAIGVLAVGLPQWALAETASGEDITNTATVSYKVENADQPAVTGTTTFKVDNRVDLTVTNTDAGNVVSVYPKTLNKVLTFTVTNEGNTVQDFKLEAINTTANGINQFEVTPSVYVESTEPANGYSTSDTETNILSLQPGAAKTVYVVEDIPSNDYTVENAIATCVLRATAYKAGTSFASLLEKHNDTGDRADQVDNFFADDAGISDGANDAMHSASASFKVKAAALTVEKTSSIIWDPINLNNNPKRIPGAYIQYALTITNTSTDTPAILSNITDALTTLTEIDQYFFNGTAATPPTSGTAAFKVSIGGPGNSRSNYPKDFPVGDFHSGPSPGGTITADIESVLPAESPNYVLGELKPGETVTLTFNVIIQ